MKNEDYYEWQEESFEDKVKREMAMPWGNPTMIDDGCSILFCSFDQYPPGQRMAY